MFKHNEASSDESGKGDFFGGLHVCACCIVDEKYKLIEAAGLVPHIQDSKNIKNDKIQELATKLMAILGDHYSLIKIKAPEYNQKYSVFKNLNIMLSWAHNCAWTDLSSKIDLSKAKKIIDDFCGEQKYYSYLADISENAVKLDEFATKAERKYFACAIASIIARNSFINEIKEMSEKCNYAVPFGNSYALNNSVVIAFKKIKEKFKSHDKVLDCCKNHFKTMDKI